MNYENITFEEIESLFNKAEKVFNSPEEHSSQEMKQTLLEIDALLLNYYKLKYGDKVTWMPSASSF